MRKIVKGTTLIISHQERILNIADKIIVIANGEISKQGTKEEVLSALLNQTGGCRFMKGEE